MTLINWGGYNKNKKLIKFLQSFDYLNIELIFLFKCDKEKQTIIYIKDFNLRKKIKFILIYYNVNTFDEEKSFKIAKNW